MAWNDPRTWVVGELVTATLMNTYLRDNLADLDARYIFGGPPIGAQPGMYYHFGRYDNVGSDLNLVANQAYYVPFHVPVPVTVDRIGYQNQFGDTGTIRMGIYADTGGFRPGNLYGGEVTGSSTLTGIQAYTINVSLVRGNYWYVIVYQGAAPAGGPDAVQASSDDDYTWWVVGKTVNDPANPAVRYIQAGVTGALPATATPTHDTSAATPRLFLRVSSG